MAQHLNGSVARLAAALADVLLEAQKVALAPVEQRLDGVDTRLGGLETRLETLESRVDEHAKASTELMADVERRVIDTLGQSIRTTNENVQVQITAFMNKQAQAKATPRKMSRTRAVEAARAGS